MACYNICLIPFILIYRFIVWVCFCCFQHHQTFYSSISEQLESRRSIRGGWYENVHREFINTRDTFYILLAMYNMKAEKTCQLEWKFIQRLHTSMTQKGHIPWGFYTHWFNGEIPIFDNDGIDVVDANALFIIMTCRYYTFNDRDINSYPHKDMHTLWLGAQRAWEWLNNQIDQDVFLEPVGASWAYSSVHNGDVLLTNVYITHAARSMELLAIYNRDSFQQNKYRKIHQAFMARIVPEIYKTQETLPRILAVNWNMVPNTFIISFNAQITEGYVPTRLPGPINVHSTWSAKIKGKTDQFTTIIWPWIGLFWIVVLAKKNKKNEVRAWWTSYMEYHNPHTLYDMYSPKTHKPLRRAFLKASPMHALTLAMQLAASDASFDDSLI